jgi:hypothetical protein
MSANDLHERTAPLDSAPVAAGPEATSYDIDWDTLRSAGRACCCLAKPAVVVIMLAGPGRPHPTDLLLCGHHYRVSRKALAAAGAVAFSPDGVPVPANDEQAVAA